MKKITHNWCADNQNGTYVNPILYTDYSDPDAIRVGEDYYMIASSFSNTPGLPILHSKDLVNWEVINYAVPKLPYKRYDEPCHGCGIWAPAIRYENNLFYIFFPLPDEGIFVTTAKNPRDTWTPPTAVFEGKGWIDPCPFWDDDGKVYMVLAFAKSRIGFKSILNLCELDPVTFRIKDMGRTIFDGNSTGQETIEGPKMHKKNGYYYIFAPAGGVKTGWQTVLRSSNVWGPYEEYKEVLKQGDTSINGPHQGAWVDTPDGKDWFIHFQDVFAAGRIVHLQPMKWENDWPVIGNPVAGTCYGTPVKTYEKPISLPMEPMVPDSSDEFETDTLGLQWQWNANYSMDWYRLNPALSSIELKAVSYKKERSIANMPNLLLQKWCMPEFTAITKLNLMGLKVGDVTGLISMGILYGAIGVKREENSLKLIQITGEQIFENEKATSVDIEKELRNLGNINEIYFKNKVIQVDKSEMDIIPTQELEEHSYEKIKFSYSLDGINYTEVFSIDSRAGRWVGVKNGLFCYNRDSEDTGMVSSDYFRIDNQK